MTAPALAFLGTCASCAKRVIGPVGDKLPVRDVLRELPDTSGKQHVCTEPLCPACDRELEVRLAARAVREATLADPRAKGLPR